MAVRSSAEGGNDSNMGKTCHQCRQKTTRLMSSCQNQKNGKPCPIKFCQKCLLNRYGEKVEEVELIADWQCPKCRGICNCSLCMKKKGHEPTGPLAQTAKATGFSSVSEMLLVKGPEAMSAKKAVKEIGGSPNKLTNPSKKASSLPRKRGKENSFDGRCDPNLPKESLISIPDEESNRGSKRECIKGNDSSCIVLEDGKNNANVSIKSSQYSCISEDTAEKLLKKEDKVKQRDGAIIVERDNTTSKPQIPRVLFLDTVQKGRNTSARDEIPRLPKNDSRIQVSKKESNECIKKEERIVDIVQGEGLLLGDEKNPPYSGDSKDNKAETKMQPKYGNVNQASRIRSVEFEAEISFPQGTELTAVAGIDLPSEDVGHALQFLEFCKAFGPAFNLKKGQPELILRELAHQRSRRRGQHSPIVHFHIQLLSLLQKDSGEKPFILTPTSKGNSWLQALGDWISESHQAFADLPSNCFDKSGDGYERLSISQKLRILNFLCDDTLGTMALRSWIDNQNLKFVNKAKEAKDKVHVAKEKERQVKLQMHEEMARASVISISEYDLLSKLKSEAAKAHAEILEAMEKLPKKKQRSDAVRTEPIVLDADGHIFWRLSSSFGEQSILLQDVGGWDSISPKENWFVYPAEQNKEVESYISSIRHRKKMRRMQKVPEQLEYGTQEASMKCKISEDPSSPLSVVEDS